MYETYLIMRALVFCIGLPCLALWLLCVRKPRPKPLSRRREKVDSRRTYAVTKRHGGRRIVAISFPEKESTVSNKV